jgi:ABC-type nitrate/sulfonate/bicarbonate transport system permease component
MTSGDAPESVLELRSVARRFPNRTAGFPPFTAIRNLSFQASQGEYVLAGLGIGATLAVIAIIVGELVGGEVGLGYLISFGQGQTNTAVVFHANALLTVIGIAMYWAAVRVVTRILHYVPSAVHSIRSAQA